MMPVSTDSIFRPVCDSFVRLFLFVFICARKHEDDDNRITYSEYVYKFASIFGPAGTALPAYLLTPCRSGVRIMRATQFVFICVCGCVRSPPRPRPAPLPVKFHVYVINERYTRP